MTFSRRLTQLSLGGLAVFACAALSVPAPAHAGPIELFRNVQQNPANPDQLVAAYIYGGGGLFVSADGGKTFGITCSGADNPDLKFERDISELAIAATGDVYIGLFNGLWKGQTNGCGWTMVPELKGHIIGAVAVDPIDTKRVYVGTSDGYNPDGTPKINGLWMKDGNATTFAQVGKQDTTWYSTLQVIKLTDTTRRFYATGVISKTVMDAMGMPSSEVHYYVRVSDDEGKTWTDNEYDINQFGLKTNTADFKIVAIDPANPDHVLAKVQRDMMPDSFVYSPMQGKAGSWQEITELGELDGVAFAPDGKLYFGDDDQNSRAFFVVEKLGDKPKMLTDTWKVGCLRWDAAGKRMLACRDWQFGTVDLTTGLFKSMLDMRCAERFVECPDQASVKKACESQLLAGYCGVTHYPVAPLCSGYDQGVDAPMFIAAQDYTCQNGQLMSKPDDSTQSSAGSSAAGASGSAGQVAAAAGGPASSATSGVTAQPTAAGTSSANAAAGAAAPAPAAKSSGCAVQPGERASGSWLGSTLALLGLAALTGRARRRRAR